MSGHILVGKTITEIMIAQDKKAILFKTDDGDIIARADGDCCSDSWIEDIELPFLGFPAKVLSVVNIDLPGSDSNDDGCLQVYGFKIFLDKGEVLVDFRNSSNGYYGGSLSWPDDYFYGGVYKQNVSNEQWIHICKP